MSSSFHNVFAPLLAGVDPVTAQWPSHLPDCSSRETFHRFSLVLGGLLGDSCLSCSFLISNYPHSSYSFGKGFPRAGVSSSLVARSTSEQWRPLDNSYMLDMRLACHGAWVATKAPDADFTTSFPSSLLRLWAMCSSGPVLRKLANKSTYIITSAEINTCNGKKHTPD